MRAHGGNLCLRILPMRSNEDRVLDRFDVFVTQSIMLRNFSNQNQMSVVRQTRLMFDVLMGSQKSYLSNRKGEGFHRTRRPQIRES